MSEVIMPGPDIWETGIRWGAPEPLEEEPEEGEIETDDPDYY
jgi:hypothetical protein